MAKKNSAAYSRYFNFALIAPLILTCVAGTQMFRAHVHEMSAWKGGGFGMFSTVDRPTWRFLRGYVQQDSIEAFIPGEALGLSSSHHLKLRTAPSHSELQRQEMSLSQTEWVIFDLDSMRASIQSIPFALQNYFMDAGTEALAILPTDSSSQMPPMGLPDRIAFARDYGTSSNTSISAVRLETWRIHFDAQNHLVYGEQIFP